MLPARCNRFELENKRLSTRYVSLFFIRFKGQSRRNQEYVLFPKRLSFIIGRARIDEEYAGLTISEAICIQKYSLNKSQELPHTT